MMVVCFLCDREVDRDGNALEHVTITAQISLLRSKSMHSTVCQACFRKSRKDFADRMERTLKAMKRLALESDTD